MQNMELDIPTNGGERILNYIMCDSAFCPMNEQNTCILNKSMGWLHMHQERPQTIGWGKPNLLCNVEEKMLESIQKDGMNGQADS